MEKSERVGIPPKVLFPVASRRISRIPKKAKDSDLGGGWSDAHLVRFREAASRLLFKAARDGAKRKATEDGIQSQHREHIPNQNR
jgi:hypothetical protein